MGFNLCLDLINNSACNKYLISYYNYISMDILRYIVHNVYFLTIDKTTFFSK